MWVNMIKIGFLGQNLFSSFFLYFYNFFMKVLIFYTFYQNIY